MNVPECDPDGNILSTTTTDGAGTHTQTATFDAEDRQTSGTDDGATTTYGYDAAGQRRTETLPGGATTLTTGLDPEGRTTALTDTTSGVGAATSLFGYNANDQPVTRTLPGGTGVRETTTYDANGRATSVVANGPGGTAQTAQARTLTRSALASQARYGVNVTALALVNPTLSSRYALGYDAASRVNNSTTLSGTDALSYDPQNRLTDESGPQVIAGSGAYHWTYDQNNNLLTATDDHIGVTDVYTYGNPAQPDQQTAGGASTGQAAYVLSYGYDGAGHTTSIVNPVGQNVSLTGPSQGDPKAMHTTFSYDAQGRVTQVVYLERGAATGATTALTPTTVLMSYNALGQRAHYTISAAGTTTTDYRFTYRDGELGQAIVTSGGQALYTNTYLYDGQGQPWEVIRTDGGGTTTRYGYVLDALGDVVALTDATGSVVDRYAYDSWGEQISNDRTDETIPQQLRYRGQYYDEKLGWYWMGDGRQYDPESARYLQPVGDPSFVYANDNPVRSGGLVPQPSSSAINSTGLCTIIAHFEPFLGIGNAKDGGLGKIGRHTYLTLTDRTGGSYLYEGEQIDGQIKSHRGEPRPIVRGEVAYDQLRLNYRPSYQVLNDGTSCKVYLAKLKRIGRKIDAKNIPYNGIPDASHPEYGPGDPGYGGNSNGFVSTLLRHGTPVGYNLISEGDLENKTGVFIPGWDADLIDRPCGEVYDVNAGRTYTRPCPGPRGT